MLNPLDLVHDQANFCHETIRIMVMQNVHVDALAAACQESIAVMISLDAAANSRQHQGARVDGLQVASGHLQYHGVGRRHRSDNLGTALDTPASFVLLGLVQWDLEL